MTKSRVFRSLLKSYVAVLILPMVLCSFVFGYTTSAVKSQLEAANQATLATLRDMVDAYIKDAYNTIAYIIINETVLSFKNTAVVRQSDLLTLQTLQSRIQRYVAQSAIIQNIYVAFRASDMLLSRDRSAHRIDAENIIRGELSLPAAEWATWFRLGRLRTQRLYEYVDAAGRSQQQLLLLQKDNKAGGERLARVVVTVQVNMGVLKEILSNYTTENASGCYITDGSGIYIAMAGDAYAEQPGGGWRYGKLSTLTLPSEVSGLQYILVPSNGIARMIQYMTLIMAIYYVLCIIIGMVLVWKLSKKSYSPLQNLLSSVLRSLDLTHMPGNDEYSAIEKVMLDTLTRMRDSDHRLDTYRSVGRDSMLRRLLNGHSGLKALRQSEIFSFDFLSDRFCVILYSLEDIDLNISGDEALSVDLIDFLVITMIQELKLPDCQKYAFVQDTMLACLVNLPEKAQAEETEMLIEDARHTLTYLSERMSISTMAAISSVYSAEDSLQAAYYEARDVLNYMQLLGLSGQALHISQMCAYDESYDVDLFRSLDLQRRLLNALREGQYGQAHIVQEELFQLYFGMHRGLTGRQMDLRLSTVIEMLASAFCNVRLRLGEAFDSSLTEALYHCTDLASLKAWTAQTFARMEALSGPVPAKDRDTRIVSYITDHYMDPELNLNTLADAFHLSPSYCSQMIRRCVGVSASDYIKQLRLDAAKRLLTDTDQPLKEIAEAVGFGSSLNLIRAFKRQDGLTPSVYREISRR